VRVPDAAAGLLAASEAPAAGRAAFVEGPADWIGFAARGESGPARIVEDHGGRLSVAVAPAPAPRVLVLADTYEPGWKAFAGGVRLRVLPADCMFRAVAVPPRAARVAFTYDPWPFKAGLLLAAWAAGCLAALVARAARGRRPA
jgi:hypothetical protein